MNTVKVILVSLALLAASPASFANDLKIGVVNASRILDQSPQKDRALERLEKEFSANFENSKHHEDHVNCNPTKANAKGIRGVDHKLATLNHILMGMGEIKSQT